MVHAHDLKVLSRYAPIDSSSGSLAMLAVIRQASSLRISIPERRQGQNHPSGFVLYDHHQSWIVVRALFSQLHDFALT
jgi:hypothetical protein